MRLFTYLLLIFCAFVNTQAYADTWTFICPIPSYILVENDKWEAKMTVFKNDEPYPFPATWVYHNPPEKPVAFAYVDLFPNDDPDSEINCHYTTPDGELGFVSTFPYELPQDCHFLNGISGRCYGEIEECDVKC